MSNPSHYPTVSNSQGNTQLPYARDPSTLSPVPYGVPSGTSGSSIKNRERTDVRQLEAPNRMYGCTSSSPTEERNELGYGAKVNLGGMGVELWLVHAFVFTMYHLSIIDSSPRYQNNKQTTHSGRRNSAKSESGSRGK
jgi:hypothetical protein